MPFLIALRIVVVAALDAEVDVHEAGAPHRRAAAPA